MKRHFYVFLTAMQFFTRLPIPQWVGFEAAWLREAARFFPLIGVLVGVVTASVLLVAAHVLPLLIAVLLSTMAGIFLTGALHEDGFADVCDGFGGGNTREKIIEIMRDSRVGAYGAIGIGLLLALKIAALASMPLTCAAWALLLAHPLSRLASAAVIWRMDYATSDGKASLAGHTMTLPVLLGAGTPVLLLLVVMIASDALPARSIAVASMVMAVTTVWLGRKFQRHLGGYTGDCLGAVQQCSEALCYLSLLAVGT